MTTVVPSYRRTVVPSYRRTVVPLLSALLFGILMPSGGAKAEVELDGDFEEEGYTQVIFGGPGEITFDAGDGNSAFPVSETQFSFANWHDYALFLRDAFNADLEFNDDGEVVELLLTVMTIGEPLALAPSLTHLIPVRDPVATMVGGLSGTIEVDGEIYCVNEDRCSNGRSPLALGPLDTDAAAAGAGGSTSSVVLQGPAFEGYETTVAAPPSFSIIADSYVPASPIFVGGVLRYFHGITKQGVGGYNRVVGGITWERVCPGKLPKRSNFVPYFEVCYFVPKYSALGRGSNYLFLDMKWVRLEWVNGVCEEVQKHYKPISGRNVSEVKIDTSAWWSAGEPPSSKAHGIVFATWIDTFHFGQDLDTYDYDIRWRRYGTGAGAICSP